MWRQLSLSAVLSLAAVTAAAEDGSAGKVAVFDFKASGIDETTAANLTETFTSEAGKVPGYKLTSQSEIKELLGFEQQKQMLGCTDDSCFTNIGGALGVDFLITGSIGKVGETFLVNIRLIDVKRTSTKNRLGESILGRVELLPEFMRIAAWRIFAQPVPKDVDASYQLTKAKLEEGMARQAGDAAKQAEAEKARAEAEKAKAEAEKAKAEAEQARLQRSGQTAAVTTGAAPPAPPPPDHWTSTAKSASIAAAVLGIIGGGAMTGLSLWQQGEVGESHSAADGGSVYDGPRSAAVLATTFETISVPCYIVGGVGVAAAIVFAILEPAIPATSAVQLLPTANGLALTF